MPATAPPERSANLASSRDGKPWKHALDFYSRFEKGFQEQAGRATDIASYWKLYQCELGNDQLYSGRARLFAPFTREAIQARSTRFVNQLFPDSQRHVEAFSSEGSVPRALLGMVEHYIRNLNLREIIHAASISGDVEGQYNLYVSWEEGNRRVRTRVGKKKVNNSEGMALGDATDIVEEKEAQAGPRLEILSDSDVCILPATAQSIPDAFAQGGGVAILRRWTKHKLQQMIRDGHVSKVEGNALARNIEHYKDGGSYTKDPAKGAIHAAGIKKDGRGPYALIYEIWAEMEIEEGEPRLCQFFVAGHDIVLMARRNPLWCDLCPLISAPVEPIYGTFKGVSKCMAVMPLQIFANDMLNEMADSAVFSQMPVTMRDPAYITSPLVMAPGAVWDIPPNGASFAEMPPVWQQGAMILAEMKQEIFQVLSVNPSMITQQTKKKMNQAEVAQEQQVDVLTTADAVRSLRDLVLNALVNFLPALDYQYREEAITVRQFGEFGMQSMLEEVSPLQQGSGTVFYWIGDELIRSMQQVQQKVAFLNVLRQVPPQAWQRYTVDYEPILLDICETILGPRISRLSVKSLEDVLAVPPDKENAMMAEGNSVLVHPFDDAQEHISSHKRFAQENGDPRRLIEAHIVSHAKAEAMKQQAQAMAAAGGQQGPGARPGAQPASGRPAQQPPGAIHQDQMHAGMPRKM